MPQHLDPNLFFFGVGHAYIPWVTRSVTSRYNARLAPEVFWKSLFGGSKKKDVTDVQKSLARR